MRQNGAIQQTFLEIDKKERNYNIPAIDLNILHFIVPLTNEEVSKQKLWMHERVYHIVITCPP